MKVSIAPLTASTKITSPTSANTYLANRPWRSDPIFSQTPFIQTSESSPSRPRLHGPFRPQPLSITVFHPPAGPLPAWLAPILGTPTSPLPPASAASGGEGACPRLDPGAGGGGAAAGGGAGHEGQ